MAERDLNFGVIGLSEGNGHPYSWSAIFNGYDKVAMRKCPFPAIPEYLAEQKFPEDSIKGAKVSHIWTQDLSISKEVASASLIETVCLHPDDMIGRVDGVLLARDDAEHHKEMAEPFLENGIPVFIDKPIALDVKSAQEIFSFGDLVYSCSSLRFAEEFALHHLEGLGDIHFIKGTVPNSWEKYAVHIIEPALNLIPNRGHLTAWNRKSKAESRSLKADWSSGITTEFITTGSVRSPLQLTITGNEGSKILKFTDSFLAFKRSLQYFLDLINGKVANLPRELTLDVVDLIEKGIE
ncbi:MAG: Gfo/Idh/MocA family oxidoreductase [Flavobacteriales bacterium]|nr:Gfo/Idh/MocA family oxidoreductase [Flavobacteriales bacterium]